MTAPREPVNRERVIDAAAQIADEHGVDAVKPAAVAAALGIRAPSLYNHVSGGDDVRAALARRGSEELLAAYRGAAVGLAGADALRAAGRTGRAYALAHPGLYEAAQRPIADDAVRNDAENATLEIFFAILAPFGLEGDDALHAMRIVRSALHGFVSLELTGGFGYPLDIDTSFERLLDVVIAGLHAPVHPDAPAR